jgi:hypothetical protein
MVSQAHEQAPTFGEDFKPITDPTDWKTTLFLAAHLFEEETNNSNIEDETSKTKDSNKLR